MAWVKAVKANMDQVVIIMALVRAGAERMWNDAQELSKSLRENTAMAHTKMDEWIITMDGRTK